MSVSCGKILVDELIDGLKKYLNSTMEKEIYGTVESKLATRINQKFYEEIIKRPFLIYVSEDKLGGSKQLNNGDISKYLDRCIGVDRIYDLLFLKNLTDKEKESLIAECIIYETKHEDIEKTNLLSNLIFLDFALKTTKNAKSKSIDTDLMDLLANGLYESEKLFILSSGSSERCFQSFLGTQTFKPIYIKQEFKYYENPVSLELSKDYKKSVYKFGCPLCGNIHNIYLIGHEGTAKSNVQNYIEVKTFEDHTKIYFICDHHNTKYSGNKINFSTRVTVELSNELSDENYNKTFLYLFYKFQYNQETIEYIDTEGIKEFPILQFILKAE